MSLLMFMLMPVSLCLSHSPILSLVPSNSLCVQKWLPHMLNQIPFFRPALPFIFPQHLIHFSFTFATSFRGVWVDQGHVVELLFSFNKVGLSKREMCLLFTLQAGERDLHYRSHTLSLIQQPRNYR